MQNHVFKRCAHCQAAVGFIAFKTVVDGYEKDFCDPVCVLKWVQKQTVQIEERKLQETIA